MWRHNPWHSAPTNTGTQRKPGTIVTYAGDTYDGSASDRQMVERSALMKNYTFKPDDEVMAESGVMVHDLFPHRCFHISTPHKLQGNHQLDAEALVPDCRSA